MSVPGAADASVRSGDASEAAPDTHATGMRAAAGLVAGFALLAVVDAVAIAVAVPRPPGGVALRAAHHFFDAAETLGVGAAAGAMAGAFSARVRLPPWGYAAVYAAATAPILYFALDDQLHRQAEVALEGRLTTVIFATLVLLSSLGVAAAHLVGALFSRFPRARLAPAAIGLGAMIGDQMVLRDDYLGGHAAVAWIAATLAGASLAPLAERALRALWERRAGRIALAAAGALAAIGIAVPPPNRVRLELFRQPCAAAPWVLAAVVWPAPRVRTAAALPEDRWLRDRAGDPPVPPTEPPMLPPNAIVVLVTIDALRADAVNDPRNDALFPTLTDMKRRGAWFSNARSPGTQTAVSLTTLFTGRYFSELRWGLHGVGSTRFLYAAADPAPRFPELLTAAGVATSSYCGVNFIAGEFGVARGFQDERVIPEGRRHAYARQVVDPLLDRLRRAGHGPIFAYAHLMEPHAPYDRGAKEGTDKERYISEIAVADAQLGRVSQLLEARFPGRHMLIVSADHGEAFGEHQTYEHTKTLYEELLRVPLLVRGAGVAPREVREPVGLIDLGPTILDLFGVRTPATFEGQSLVPVLAGGAVVLDRPMLAEGRLRRAITTADGLKVIRDLRREVVEAYDLEQDPGELRDVFDEDGARERIDRALGRLDAFFAAHQARGGGYRPLYKP